MFSATATGDCKVPMSLCRLQAVQIHSGGGGACQTKLSAVLGCRLAMYYVDDTHKKYAGPKTKSDQNVFLIENNFYVFANKVRVR